MKQKNIFLESEGNAWFERNARLLGSRKLPEFDSLLMEILALSPLPAEGTKILEIGCGDGTRLNWLRENLGFDCYGLEPSAQAVEAAQGRGIAAHQGTADHLPFEDRTFDIVVFGFCLYLCDREDLFRIAYEADRVLRNPGWLLIIDFYSPTPIKREYHHRSGLFSHKMDYRTLFTWHPGYTNYSHKVRHHAEDGYTDDRKEWIATAVLRKNMEHIE
ncbi:MAG: class I SAM-dependent methyltransferase [Planctomycetes bacterium]|uniref:class I SAM-dependent methyltransferase n=1 Tax=Candidatus Wunengus sp. YC65 TaxID=3367701 RepID=UPI001D95A4A7|nr:class I SAM-dependent methyltransferase [Planctomycetota bacterium]